MTNQIITYSYVRFITDRRLEAMLQMGEKEIKDYDFGTSGDNNNSN